MSHRPSTSHGAGHASSSSRGCVDPGRWPTGPDVGDHPQGGVGCAVTAAVEPVPSGLAGGGLHRASAAQGGQRGLTVQPPAAGWRRR